jgi:gas vesicle protein
MLNENGYVKGLFIGLLAGGAVGALVALLYAPKS